MSEALQRLQTLVQDGKESAAVFDVLTEIFTRLAAAEELSATERAAAEASLADVAAAKTAATNPKKESTR